MLLLSDDGLLLLLYVYRATDPTLAAREARVDLVRCGVLLLAILCFECLERHTAVSPVQFLTDALLMVLVVIGSDCRDGYCRLIFQHLGDDLSLHFLATLMTSADNVHWFGRLI